MKKNRVRNRGKWVSDLKKIEQQNVVTYKVPELEFTTHRSR